jgi:curved DNA-binding protein CbpA
VSHYDELGVEPEATAAELRRAYLALARRHHPDVVAESSPGDRAAAEERMRRINEAWSTLGDEGRRADYDRRRTGGGGGDDDRSSFQPFDPGEDDPDPLDLPDDPYRPDPGERTTRRRVATLAPVALFGASVGAFAVGLVLGLPVLLGLAVALLVLACCGFLVMPLLALARATRDEG